MAGRGKRRPKGDEAVNLDARVENADWTKRTWDLVGIDSKEKLLEWLERTQQSVAWFKRLPVYRWNKDKPGFEWLKEI